MGEVGLTPLHLACKRRNNACMVRYLCETGADVEAVAVIGDLSCTPLHVASSMGNADSVSVLVAEFGAGLESLAPQGVSALTAAAQHGHTETVARLCKLGAKVNHGAESGVTPLHLAALEGHTDTCLALLAGGADVDQATESGYTALEFCALHNHSDTAKALCAQGAAHGDALSLALEHDHKETADLLRECIEWCTPLHFLSALTPTVTRSLLRAGADIHKSLRLGGPTPLSLARSLEARGKAPPGSAAWLVLQAAKPWSIATHALLSTHGRQRVLELLHVGYGLARSRSSANEEVALLDLWREFVLPQAIER